jgi:DNA polymerase-3 subunit beta
LKITAVNSSNEKSEEFVDVEYTKEQFKIGLNVTYVSDVLNAIDTDTVVFRFKESHSACVISPLDDEDTIYLIMPINL